MRGSYVSVFAALSALKCLKCNSYKYVAQIRRMEWECSLAFRTNGCWRAIKNNIIVIINININMLSPLTLPLPLDIIPPDCKQ